MIRSLLGCMKEKKTEKEREKDTCIHALDLTSMSKRAYASSQTKKTPSLMLLLLLQEILHVFFLFLEKCIHCL